MEIKLKSLRLLNFKGIRDKEIPFDHITNLYGANRSGKTTIADSWFWLLFGKDSYDRADFEVKTLDNSNRIIPKISHEVEGVLLIDGEEVTLKRVLEENWTKKKGTAEAVFTGNTTSYFWNGVPMKQSEYQAKIASLLDDKVFKLITSAHYFNDVLKWDERRKVLVQVAGDLTDQEIAAGNTEYETLLSELGKETITDFKKKKAAEKKKLKEALETIPTRIDEATRAMPDIIDFSIVEKNLTGKRQELSGIEQQINDSVEALKTTHETINGKQKEVHGLQTEINNIEFNTRQQFINKKSERESRIFEIKRELRTKNDELTGNKRDYLNADTRKAAIIKEQDDLRIEWQKLNSEQSEILKEEFSFDESTCTCPTCKQKLPADNIEAKKAELEKAFNAGKNTRSKNVQTRQQSISETGKRLGAEVAELDSKLTTILESNEKLNTKIGQLQTELTNLEVKHQNATNNEQQELDAALKSNAELVVLKNKIEVLQAEIEALKPQPQANDLKEKKQAVLSEIEALQKQLNTREQIESGKKRIAVLNDEQKNLAQQIADIEQKEFLIENFEKAKSDELEKRVNGMFQSVRFKLFREQINGGQEPCCDTLLDGVPWSVLNTAGKVQAGLDIINVLNKHFDVSAPIFIDNRESITEIPAIDAQVISLIVSPDEPEILSISGDSQQEVNDKYSKIIEAREREKMSVKLAERGVTV